jgi:uncharacterized membrane protein YqiK
MFGLVGVWWLIAAGILLFIVLPSIRTIGPSEVGLVVKRFSFSKLTQDNPLAFNGEAGYQANLLMPGWHFLLWVLYSVETHPWVQVPAGEIGVVVAQVGAPLPIGAKSARYKSDFGNFSNLHRFIAGGGQKGVQRPVLPPGTLLPIHPVGFLVITKNRVYGVPLSTSQWRLEGGRLTATSFGLRPDQLELVRIQPHAAEVGGRVIDTIGIVTTYEGEPLDSGDIASRLGGFEDVTKMETANLPDTEVIETLLGNKNNLHNNYQDFQAFLEHGGKIGLQHDPLLYGAFALNPFLVGVEIVPMLVVQQGEVAVVKAYVGLPTADTSGTEFKHGSLVRPGHRGIWQEPLRTGKYPINPRCYQAEIVPTAILTLNWADAVSHAHSYDARLQPIVAKSREGFVFKFDLQVQIHVPDTRAPRVITSVGSMANLVNEVLQAAVGNHFRDKLQSMPAVTFIETRHEVQQEALAHISEQLVQYQVETKGVYIQDVILPEDMVHVLTQREIANQEIETYRMQRAAEEERIATEQARGTADMQSQLAQARVNVTIQENNAKAQEAKATGEAAYIRSTGMAKVAIDAAAVRESGMARAETEAALIRETGLARGQEVEAIGMARAKSFAEQVTALGQGPVALINTVASLSEHGMKVMPDILVTGSGGSLDALAAQLTKWLGGMSPVATGSSEAALAGRTASGGSSDASRVAQP